MAPRIAPAAHRDPITVEAAQFLEWERQALTWNARINAGSSSDEEGDAWMDEAGRYEGLIRETAAVGVTAARVKASLLLRLAEEFEGDKRDIAGLRSIVATLRNVSAQ